MKATESASSFKREAALDRVGGDRELLLEISQLFLDEYPTLTAEIGTAVHTKEPGKLLAAAHTLKGSLGTLSAEPAYQAALRLEVMARSGNLEDAPDAYQSLLNLLNELHKELGEFIGT